MPTVGDKPVVVYIDRSTPAGCLAFAAAEAELRGCGLVAVIAAASVGRRVRSELELVRAAHADLPLIVHDGAGFPPRPAADQGPALLVCGAAHLTEVDTARGPGRPDTAVIVFRPTAAVPAGRPPVIIGLGPEPHNDMLEFAFAAAASHKTSVRGVYSPARLSDVVDPAVESLWRDTLERWSDKYPGVTVEFSAAMGLDAAVALDVASRSAQLVVVGASATDGPAAVAFTVARRAACPVAIVTIQ